jgi:hypothetical protein
MVLWTKFTRLLTPESREIRYKTLIPALHCVQVAGEMAPRADDHVPVLHKTHAGAADNDDLRKRLLYAIDSQ